MWYNKIPKVCACAIRLFIWITRLYLDNLKLGLIGLPICFKKMVSSRTYVYKKRVEWHSDCLFWQSFTLMLTRYLQLHRYKGFIFCPFNDFNGNLFVITLVGTEYLDSRQSIDFIDYWVYFNCISTDWSVLQFLLTCCFDGCALYGLLSLF